MIEFTRRRVVAAPLLAPLLLLRWGSASAQVIRGAADARRSLARPQLRRVEKH